jgi:hypothetical protein
MKNNRKTLSSEEIRAMFTSHDLTPPASDGASIVKEYYNREIDQRGPDSPNAEPLIIGSTCILRFDGDDRLSMGSLSTLFTEAAKDFPQADTGTVEINNNRIELSARPTPAYKQLPGRTMGRRG